MADYDNECLHIKQICDLYGYGNVMEWSSALWRRKFKEKGYPLGACFVPTCPDFIKDEHRNPEQQKIYDELVNRALGDLK